MSSDKIRDLTKEAVQTMLGFELAHIGINCDSEAEAEKTADAFDGLFGFTKKVGNSSVFAGKAVEAMKSKGLGAKVISLLHKLCSKSKDLEMMGYKFNEESAKFKGDKMTATISQKRSAASLEMIPCSRDQQLQRKITLADVDWRLAHLVVRGFIFRYKNRNTVTRDSALRFLLRAIRRL